MNIKGHFETITRHKLLVMKYCFACGLYEQQSQVSYFWFRNL